LIDIMATCVELSGADYPREFAGQKILPMEGVSLTPVLAGRILDRPAPVFWEHEGNRAVRIGDWKLVSKHPGGWELYDIQSDRTETADLAAAQPERVREMAALWDAWAARVGVRPWPLAQGKSGQGGKTKKAAKK
ncbi:MAG: arylsulfatase, partial [Opitutia bacterium]